MGGRAEFYGLGYDEDFPRPGPIAVRVASGPRLFHMSQFVRLEEIQNASDHEVKMAEFAARATRWFGELAVEVQWHTLRFEVQRTGTEEPGAFIWRWEVWVS